MKIKGWTSVLKFTYVQNIKNKSFKVSTVVISLLLVLMVAGINFLPTLLADDTVPTLGESGINEDAEKWLTKLYLHDESGLSLNNCFREIIAQIGGELVEITENDLTNITETVKASMSGEILVSAYKNDDGSFYALISRPENEEIVSSKRAGEIADITYSFISQMNLINLGVSRENLAAAQPYISTGTTVASEVPLNMAAEIIKSMVPIFSSLILFIFIFAYGQMVAQSIAQEKTSRVIELLLTSIDPLAVISGKILAIGLLSLTQLVFFGALMSITTIALAPLGVIGEVIGMIETTNADFQLMATEIGAAFSHVNIFTGIIILVVFILGFLLFALIAGLIGSSISRTEDLATAMQPLSIIGVVGFYLAYFPVLFELDGERSMMTYIARYLPISSPFALPSAILMNEMSIIETIISVAVLLICDILLLIITARVYESIILHTGDRVKIKDLLKLAKN